ncbi:MAG: beta-N-acetylhexosaminidase [Hyphomicrobiaceae bacterium]|nr:beta-N-acetylhexosaminidase [Hyphomicrobiaceae bacterium]
MRSQFITGLSGPELTSEERALLAQARPAGIILFARNCLSEAQITRLVGEALAAIGTHETLVLIDQEGGRVQRLRPPLGRTLPPARVYGEMFATDADGACEVARSVYRLLADDLRALGINTNCAPVLDCPVPGAHAIIGDRAFASEVGPIARLGRAVCEGLMAGGVVPVIKHIPGHGRALADSHLELPRVSTPAADLAATDFAPFRMLADMPAAMTAHVVYEAVDPHAPATTSRSVTDDVIRGQIGFDGLLMSDDLSMQALSGSIRQRAETSLAAGCDVVLHCNGAIEEMRQALAGVGSLEGAAARRFAATLAVLQRAEPFDRAAAEAALAGCMAHARRDTESV